MQPLQPNQWWGAKSEPELRSLYEWIDQQTHGQTVGDRRGGIAGGVAGGIWGLVGGSIGILAGALQIGPAISVAVPIIVGAVASSAVLVWYLRGRTEGDKAIARTTAEMRGFFWKLMSARWQSNVKGLIGEDGALALNTAAYEYLQCKTALNSPAWQAAGSDSPWYQARERTRVAMDVAMSRLVTMVGQGAPANQQTVQDLISDMQRTAAEATATASRLAGHHNLPTDATNELRKALSEMRALNEADQEFTDLTQGS
ncbi:MAG: hypothetical protein ACAH95_04085 [Fimbriimonas sp.]